MDVVMIFLPLVAAAIAGLFWRHIGDRGAQLITCAALLVSMVLAWIVFFDVGLHHGAPRYLRCFEGQGAPHGAQAPTKSCGETARPCDVLVK